MADGSDLPEKSPPAVLPARIPVFFGSKSRGDAFDVPNADDQNENDECQAGSAVQRRRGRRAEHLPAGRHARVLSGHRDQNPSKHTGCQCAPDDQGEDNSRGQGQARGRATVEDEFRLLRISSSKVVVSKYFNLLLPLQVF